MRTTPRAAIRRRARVAPRLARVAAALCLCASGATPAAALEDCRAARQEIPGVEGPVYKLLLDELLIAGDLNRDVLRSTLQAKLQDNVEKISQEFRDIHVIVCTDRRPTNPGDIMGEVEGFTESDVVLEIWGVFDGDEVIFVQAVIPLLSRGAQEWPPTERLFQDSFPYEGQDSELRFLKRLVQDSLHLRSYTAVGIASRALMKSDYDQARKFFCHALLLLREIPTNGALSPEHERLASFVEEMSLEAVQRAANDPAYEGLLGTPEAPVGKPCLGETS